MAIVLRNVLLVAVLLAPTQALPSFPLTSSQTCNIHDQLPTHRVNADSSPLKRLRNSIIENIWNVPRKQEYRTKQTNSAQAAPSNFRKQYGDDVVLRFTIDGEDDERAFSEAARILYLDVWDSTQDWVDVRIAKQMLPSLLNLLPPPLQNSHTFLMHDLAQAVYDTYPYTKQDPWRAKEVTITIGRHDLFFDDYQRLAVIYPWMQMLVEIFPDIAELINIGSSAEGRPIFALKVGVRTNPPTNDNEYKKSRPTLLITAGAHAREWISVSTASYTLYTLLTRYAKDRIVNKLLSTHDILFIPILNPDGYEYTWTTDRLWRKTRQPTTLPFCPGIDIDHSFPFNWDGATETDNPCTEAYAGTHPFASIEASLLASWTRNYTETRPATLVAYIDLHSYSQQILYPYSYSCTDRPSNIEDLQEIAMGLAKSCRTATGNHYSVRSACEASSGGSQQSLTGGSALDYFYHDRNVPLAYQVKLPDQGSYGFLLPKSHIVPTGKEAFEALMGLGRWLLGNRGIESEFDTTDEVSDEGGDGVGGNEAVGASESGRGDGNANENENESESDWERVFDPDFELELKRRRK